MINILLLGSGGREHAIAWKIRQSPLLNKLFIAPGNAGTAGIGINVELPVNDFQAIREFVVNHSIDMIVVGPEDPLVSGIHDYFLTGKSCKLIVIGPVSSGARLEGSKDFAKEFMIRHGIPTAAFRTFTRETLQTGIEFLSGTKAPYVLKADGLAAGKGVVICETKEEAVRELKSMLCEARFGKASEKVVIEEFLSGIELSVFILTDGNTFRILPEAKDYKRIGRGDRGPNTGGMGSVSPVSFADKAFLDKVKSQVIRPTMEGLKKEGIIYQGFLFFGLIKVGDDPFVIEYNCRLGDPETESILPRISNDLVELFIAVGNQRLDEHQITTDPRFTATVMMVAEGYPGPYTKGKVITGFDQVSDGMVFHAGTTVEKETGNTVTSGGRVLAVTSFGNTMNEALNKSYNNTGIIHFEGKYYRDDIGFDL